MLSKATVATIGLSCKAFLNSGLCSIQVNGLQNLQAALQSHGRNSGQGLVTISNHISTLDDPVTWGVLPASYYLSSRTTRWALGASDIMFTNPVFSAFFSLGQTIETFRGKGIYQAAVDTAIQKVDQGNWASAKHRLLFVHLYGEGKVNQPNTYSKDEHGCACLPRFKWGVGRILMEAKTQPVVIPMWLTGFDQLMPEGRRFPYKYLPRIGARLSVTFGDPIRADIIKEALAIPTIGFGGPDLVARNDVNHEASGSFAHSKDAPHTSLVRQKVTAVVQREIEALGRSISGSSLTGHSS
ncbi:acyltransferase-domain-containing protein [Crassisporium funariophilum]|nr:acyltransferase-domain-containing protein [Crassisporium funariophilum]